jgi:hypothetical protein
VHGLLSYHDNSSLVDYMTCPKPMQMQPLAATAFRRHIPRGHNSLLTRSDNRQQSAYGGGAAAWNSFCAAARPWAIRTSTASAHRETR